MCCAVAYQSEWATLLLGESFHPGGLALTEHLGRTLGLTPNMRVLDVAAGKGTSAIYLAQTFGVAVVGIDYGSWSVEAAIAAANAAGVGERVHFQQGDAEHFPSMLSSSMRSSANALSVHSLTRPLPPVSLPECSSQVVRSDMTDLTRRGETPEDLQGLLAWVACIADAQPLDAYETYLREAGLTITLREEHNSCSCPIGAGCTDTSAGCRATGEAQEACVAHC